MSNKLLNTGSLIFFAIILLGLLTSRFPAGRYRTSNAFVLEAAIQDDFIMDYAELAAIQENEGGKIQLIDLRKPEDFSRGHISGALNIPDERVFDKENKKLFEEEGTKVLYSDQEMHTLHTAMMLLGKGFTGIRVLPGSFNVIEAHMMGGNPNPAFMHYRDDKARFDYPRFMQGTGVKGPDTKEASKPVVPEIKTEVLSVQGGC